jgi:hypothetical protein
MNIKKIFLIYDSRSGSTYLSSRLNAKLRNYIVTPEINLNLFLELCIKYRPVNSTKIINALKAGRVFDKLGIPIEIYKATLNEFNVSQTIDALDILLEIYIKRIAPDGIQIEGVIIKKGDHHKKVKCIVNEIPNVKFVYLSRDPRQIYESKKRTIRPYVPGQTMGWAGPIVSAVIWTRYEKCYSWIQEHADGIEVRYEDLVKNEDAEIERISDYLSAERDYSEEKKYEIPELEQSIHRRVDQKRLDPKVAGDWLKSLTYTEIGAIEFASRPYLSNKGYQQYSMSELYRICCFLIRLPELPLRLVFGKIFAYRNQLK